MAPVAPSVRPQFGGARSVPGPFLQLRKRLSVGAEGLYGMRETKGGSDGEVFRFQLCLLYSISG
jgi:hypothetical protein